METPLNDGDLWNLERIIFFDDMLDVYVIEGIVSETPSPLEIDVGDKVVNLGESYSIDITEQSRRFRISFES